MICCDELKSYQSPFVLHIVRIISCCYKTHTVLSDNLVFAVQHSCSKQFCKPEIWICLIEGGWFPPDLCVSVSSCVLQSEHPLSLWKELAELQGPTPFVDWRNDCRLDSPGSSWRYQLVHGGKPSSCIDYIGLLFHRITSVGEITLLPKNKKKSWWFHGNMQWYFYGWTVVDHLQNLSPLCNDCVIVFSIDTTFVYWYLWLFDPGCEW